MSASPPDELQGLADAQLAALLERLPQDPTARILLFMDATRVLDYRSVFQGLLSSEMRMALPTLELCHWGWGLAATHLLHPLEDDGVPFAQLDRESLEGAQTLLYHFGLVMLMRRVAEMTRAGFAELNKEADRWVLRMSGALQAQHADNIEFSRWEEMSELLDTASQSALHGWQLMQVDGMAEIENKVGAFLGRDRFAELRRYERSDLEELMASLIKPWDTGKGTLMGYGAQPELDDHYLALATRRAIRWRDATGIHPKASFGCTTGSDVTAMAAIVASLHLKHIQFALVALKRHPSISIPHSLTIWERREQLVAAIAEWSPFSEAETSRALDALTLKPSDLKHLSPYSAFPKPLLVDLGNGYLLRPVSGVLGNPLVCALTMLEWRNPPARARMIACLEEWMRDDLYAGFQGNRYVRIKGNVKVRDAGRTVTDIDAAVLDRTSGELALFQLKWQDYFTNDVRKLRSRAKNLAQELETWAAAVSDWIMREGLNGITRSLRLNARDHGTVSSVHIFGISRTAARVDGYGFSISRPDVAVASWSRFQRVRLQAGPAQNIFSVLHSAIRQEAAENIPAAPHPFEVNVVGQRILIENLWQVYDDRNEPNSEASAVEHA